MADTDQSGRVEIELERPYLPEPSVVSDAEEHQGELLYDKPGGQFSSGIFRSGKSGVVLSPGYWLLTSVANGSSNIG